MDSVSSASKKRKISHDDHDEEDEEEKMEKFYALIKSIREARDRLIMTNREAADQQSKMKKRKLEVEEENKQVVVWKPSFQIEDFLGEADDQLKKVPPMSFASTSSKTKEETDNDQKEEVKEELDLTLSL